MAISLRDNKNQNIIKIENEKGWQQSTTLYKPSNQLIA